MSNEFQLRLFVKYSLMRLTLLKAKAKWWKTAHSAATFSTHSYLHCMIDSKGAQDEGPLFAILSVINYGANRPNEIDIDYFVIVKQ